MKPDDDPNARGPIACAVIDRRAHACDSSVGVAGSRGRVDDESVASGTDTGRLRSIIADVIDLDVAPAAGAQIDQIRALEDLKAACAAAQARITAQFTAARRAAAAPPEARDDAADSDCDVMREGLSGAVSSRRLAAEVRRKAERLARRSAAAEIALARRESPQRGGRLVGLADALMHEMPHTYAALRSGVLNEWRATLLVRETACLSAAHRMVVDAEIASDQTRLDGMGDAGLIAWAKKIAYRLDPQAAVRRSVRAAADRRVSLRPTADSMAYLTQLLPLPSAVACFASLQRSADLVGAQDADRRTRQQLMADESVARLIGTAPASRQCDPDRSSADRSGADRSDPDQPDADRPGAVRSDPGQPGAVRSGAVQSEPADPHSSVASGGTIPGSGIGIADPVEAIRQSHADFLASGGRARRGTDLRGAHPAGPAADPAQHEPHSPPTASPATADSVGSSPITASPPARPGSPPLDSPPLGSSPPVNATAIPPGVGVMLNVTISDRTLFAGGDEPALLSGHIPIPAPIARRMLADLPSETAVWLRRLYVRPDSRELVAMDSRRRTFPPAMRRLLFLRDHDTCRTPWCNAPARHADHVVPAAAGGRTAFSNGQALSEDCNYIRTAAGWSATTSADGTITVATPTGHRYHSPVRPQPVSQVAERPVAHPAEQPAVRPIARPGRPPASGDRPETAPSSAERRLELIVAQSA